ncbi:hypothetical protein GGX14DRAFT_612391 [Mycena pura]|uniref:Transmembrane protein n=1 Tax=Mycena pura TaxID=153505 RepID=A0AAD7E4D3_9AGAR|nr:hypothetical protein GGX14DRAFT_612391 [Mycena pura]
MRPLPLAFFSLSIFYLIYAAPAPDAISSDPESTTFASTFVRPAIPASTSTSLSQIANNASSIPPSHKPTSRVKHRPGTSLSKPSGIRPGGMGPTRTGPPGPPAPPGSAPTHFHAPPPLPSPQSSPHRTSIAALVFEILGVLAAVLLLLSIARCVYIYKRTPAHDRISTILHRHQLQREMEELERNPARIRGSIEPPPPPYLRPPSYENEHTPLSRSSRRGSVSYASEIPQPQPPNG